MIPKRPFLVGISHKTASIAERERAAVPEPSQPEVLRALHEDLPEALLLSTCNRVEIYGVEQPGSDARVAKAFFEARLGAAAATEVYTFEGDEAVRHAFRVAASLDSMVVGEPQILGQVKAAMATAAQLKTSGRVLGRLFDHALACAKRVRTETDIASGAVSVSSIAAQLAMKIFGNLNGKRVLLLGAGEMGEAAAKALANSGAELVVMNRSPERAQRVATACGGTTRPHEEMVAEMGRASVVITSTSSDRFIVSPSIMKAVVKLRKRRPLFVIDIALPRDVDPRCAELPNVFLYDVDDLQTVAAENVGRRKREAQQAEAIVNAEVLAFAEWRRTLSFTPTIVALREHFEGVADAELNKALAKLPELDDKQLNAVRAMSKGIVGKLLHPAMLALKSGPPEERAAIVDAMRSLYALDDQTEDELEDAPGGSLEPIKGSS